VFSRAGESVEKELSEAGFIKPVKCHGGDPQRQTQQNDRLRNG
jgi:hypothetical protein